MPGDSLEVPGHRSSDWRTASREASSPAYSEAPVNMDRESRLYL